MLIDLVQVDFKMVVFIDYFVHIQTQYCCIQGQGAFTQRAV